MRGFTAEPPYVPFADIYLAWHPNGLYLATIGMDYMHPEDVSYEESFPRPKATNFSSWFIRRRAYHFAVHFMPRDLAFSPDDATNARGNIALIPYLYTYSHDGHRQPLSGATVQYLNAEAPRISCEAHFPPQVFRLPFLTGRDETEDEYCRDFPLPRAGNVLERRNGGQRRLVDPKVGV